MKISLERCLPGAIIKRSNQRVFTFLHPLRVLHGEVDWHYVQCLMLIHFTHILPNLKPCHLEEVFTMVHFTKTKTFGRGLTALDII